MPIFILSPAKTLDESPLPSHLSSFSPLNPKTTSPRFETVAEEFVEELKLITANKLQSFLGVSASLASLNHKRYQNWDQQERKCALLLFNGDAYQGMKPWELSPEDLVWCGNQVRILSGLYGILSPVDVIKPYRLDMSKKLKNSKGMDVFWREKVSQALKEDLEKQFKKEEERFIVNCASQEYFKAIDEKIVGYPVITVHLPGPAIFAKRGRGSFVRFAIEKRVVTKEDLENFEGNDGEYSLSQNSKTNSNKAHSYTLTFARDASKATKITKKLSTPKTPPALKTSKTVTMSTATATTRETRAATKKRKQEERESEDGAKKPTKRAKK